jgi:GNAT superfamily N-acetyltransferase
MTMRTNPLRGDVDAAGSAVPRGANDDDAGVAARLRPARAEDASEAGRIAYEAFHAIATRHGFPPDFDSPEIATGLMQHMLSRADIHGVVAERDGRLIGSNFLWEGDPVAGVGPITVDPATQDASVGRALMEAVLRRASERRAAGVRLVQAAYHNRSLALYTKLGFAPREPLSVLQGPVPEVANSDRIARIATEVDVGSCNGLALRVLGQPRTAELRQAIAAGQARVVERHGRITGYTTGIGFFGHAIGEANEDVQALIGAAPEISGPGMLVPTRNEKLLRWCLAQGLRIVQPMTLMSIGEYRAPGGAYIPSILY